MIKHKRHHPKDKLGYRLKKMLEFIGKIAGKCSICGNWKKNAIENFSNILKELEV